MIYHFFLSIVKFFVGLMNYTNVQRVRGHHVISYWYNNKEYKIIYKHSKRRGIPVQVLNEDDNDVTEEVSPYFGPFHDFHGGNVTPTDLGHKRLKVRLLKGDVKEFGEGDIIEI